MNHDRLQRFRRQLLARRIALLHRRQQTLSEEQALLEEREPDWEDAAALTTAAAVMETVGESEHAALARIELALERIERGSYDRCTFCAGRIDEARLRAVPETNRCAGCAPQR